MSMSTPLEIERKFLIRMPDLSVLSSQKDISIRQITQTYLVVPNGCTRRVRKSVANGTISYRKTEKMRISALSAFEEETEISEEEYLALLREADASLSPIEKMRYTFPHGNHLMEIDIYPFWRDRAILEIELSAEEEEYAVPSFLSVIREVSDDKRYKNVNLARSVVTESIELKENVP